ncbi:cupin domain-containing protein [Pollutimonas bauzanensis]|uniref:Cupin domain protein n=1 Tax=Pollutimonas bauzanensis TaxID=658167 RepID=A0A1M5VXS7_9BURK|nr:cupin domain-containing protein [Pollutimonas bauzanensis]SHH80065.1 Cupin domain protein [Pollutimonas bauzanensis]
MPGLKQAALALLLIADILTGVADAAPPEAIVTQVMEKPLDDYPGKEALMITVEYPPGAADPVHRHHAHGFIYVLEGSIIMQLRGGQEVALTPGQSFYEGPNDVHTVGRNASQTRPAKFLALLLKDKGAPILVPEH